MATIDTTLNVTSDISSYGLSISNNMRLTRAGSNTGLDYATGLVRKTLTSTNEVDLLTVGAGTVVDVPTDKFSAKLYIKNVNSDASEYFTVGLGKASAGASKEDFSVADSVERSVELGRLYSGDFMITRIRSKPVNNSSVPKLPRGYASKKSRTQRC